MFAACGLIIAIVRIALGDSPRSMIEMRHGVLVCIRVHYAARDTYCKGGLCTS